MDFYVSNDMGPNFVWENQGQGTFVDRGLVAGAAMNRNGACEAGMSVEAADFDRDGDADVAVNHLNGPVALLRNDSTPAGGWLQIELIGRSSNRSGVGAVLSIDLGRQRLVRTRQAGSGYCSCDEERLLIGLGDAARVQRVSVRWPSGRRESWADVPRDSFVRLREGTGQR